MYQMMSFRATEALVAKDLAEMLASGEITAADCPRIHPVRRVNYIRGYALAVDRPKVAKNWDNENA